MHRSTAIVSSESIDGEDTEEFRKIVEFAFSEKNIIIMRGK